MDYLLHAATLPAPHPHHQSTTPPHSPASSTHSPPTRYTSSRLPPPLTPAMHPPAAASPAHIAAARTAASEAILQTGTTATFALAAHVVRAAPLTEAPRRGDRVLPGRSDTSVAAAYMLGGTPDPELRGLLERWDVGAPRAARVKAAEGMWKDRVKVLIAALNERGAREGRAENLAALRVCEVISDVLDGFVLRELRGRLDDREREVAGLRAEVERLRRGAGYGAVSEMTSY